jgi:hypothetical protein
MSASFAYDADNSPAHCFPFHGVKSHKTHLFHFSNFSKLAAYNGSECERVIQYIADTGKEYQQSDFSEVCKYGSIVLAIGIALREVSRLIMSLVLG